MNEMSRVLGHTSPKAKPKARFDYMPVFGNDFETESLPGALPQGMN